MNLVPSSEMIDFYKTKYPSGTEIRIDSMKDDPYPVPAGTVGRVTCVDDIGTLHCIFENGRNLGVIPGVDSFHTLREEMLKNPVQSQKPEQNQVQKQQTVRKLKEELSDMENMVGRKYLRLIDILETGNSQGYGTETTFLNARMLFLTGKPEYVNFPGGSSVFVRTWPETAKAILQHCCQDEIMHERIKQLCDRVAGRKRMLLSSHREAIRNPVEIEEGIYFETQYSPVNMMLTIREKILDRIRYDYSGISITTLRIPAMKQSSGSPEEMAELRTAVTQKWNEMRRIMQELRQEIETTEQEEIPEICEEPEEFCMMQM